MMYSWNVEGCTSFVNSLATLSHRLVHVDQAKFFLVIYNYYMYAAAIHMYLIVITVTQEIIFNYVQYVPIVCRYVKNLVAFYWFRTSNYHLLNVNLNNVI